MSQSYIDLELVTLIFNDLSGNILSLYKFWYITLFSIIIEKCKLEFFSSLFYWDPLYIFIRMIYFLIELWTFLFANRKANEKNIEKSDP